MPKPNADTEGQYPSRPPVEGAPAAVDVPRRFFARVEGGHLVPIDDAGLPDGAFVLVEAQRVAGAPTSRAMRRIAALRAPDDLPADFAERHDDHAHGRRS